MVEEMNQLRCLLIELFDILLHIVLAALALVAILLTLVLLGVATLLINFWVILDHILGTIPFLPPPLSWAATSAVIAYLFHVAFASKESFHERK
jgi:hypothetical protein